MKTEAVLLISIIAGLTVLVIMALQDRSAAAIRDGPALNLNPLDSLKSRRRIPDEEQGSSMGSYLDNNATTPPFGEVIKRVSDCARFYFANPSSMHIAGQRSRAELERCRSQIRMAVSASRYGVAFTSGATESNNLAIRACVRDFRKATGLAKVVIVTTPLEHPSIYETLASMPDVEVKTLKVNKEGLIDLSELASAIASDDVAMACISAASSEISTLQDTSSIAAACRAAGVHCHLDMTQVFGRYPVNLNLIGPDSATMSGHKFHGPKGVGALFYNLARPAPTPCTTGGKQEEGVRGGTENLPGIAGMTLALQMCGVQLKREYAAERLSKMRDRLEAGILAAVPTGGVAFLGPKEDSRRMYQTISVVLPAPSVELVQELSLQKVYIGVGGCACSKGKYSRALDAVGVSAAEMTRTVRISLGFLNTEGDVSRFLKCLRIALARVGSR
jgi:cysteine desulfurase